MKDLPVRNIFIPAALVASSIFSVLTLPVAFKQLNNPTVNKLPIFSQMHQMNVDNVHKDIAIPYIGTVIVLSAGAGIATAELARKHYARQEQSAAAAENTSSTGIHYGGKPTEISFLLADLPLEDPTLQWPTPSQPHHLSASSPSETSLVDDFSKDTMTPETWSDFPASNVIDQPTPELEHKVIVFPGQYQRCRIRVPNHHEQLYAIEFNEQFYSLLNASIPKDQALAAIEQLTQENHAAILTRMNQGYAVWVLEAQATLVSVA